MLTDEELAAIRATAGYGNAKDALLDHIAAQQQEIDTLRAGLDAARRIVAAVAASEPINDAGYCIYCTEDQYERGRSIGNMARGATHRPDCPWVMAQRIMRKEATDVERRDEEHP